MYLVALKSAVVEALRDHFNAAYAEGDFKNTWISIEYPREQINYPGVWINYADAGELERAGIDHREILINELDEVREVTRWRFSGAVSFTAAALTSLERDRLYDEVVRTLAFAGIEGPHSSVFREGLEDNDFIAINGNFDVLAPSGEAASPGSPWGGDEIIYEKTISFDLIGEFVSDPGTQALVTLRDVQVMGYREGTTAPAFPDDTVPDPDAPAWNPHVWT